MNFFYIDLMAHVDNATPPVTDSVTVSTATNHITTSGYGYDSNGNMTNDGVNTLVYDAENRVVSDADGSGTASYSYNSLGLRVQKSFGGTSTVYIFSKNNDISEYANGSLSEEYIYAGITLLADYNSGTLSYHGFDRLSDRINMDVNGNKTGEQGHYPYGENWYATNSTTKWRFTNYERDSESSNDYAKARYHVNRLGRFLTVDSVRPTRPDPQLMNRYSYVASDPINRIDPTGRYACVNPPGFNIGCVCSDPEGGFGECVPGGGCGEDGGDCDNPITTEPPPPTLPCLPGTTDCSFYSKECKKAKTFTSKAYYCEGAPKVCEDTPDGPYPDCVRLCLQISDRCLNVPNNEFFSCQAKNHAFCFGLCAPCLF